MPKRILKPDRRVLHGTVFALLWGTAAMVPALRVWPWIWVTPLAAYFAFVVAFPSLRCSLNWVRTGRINVLSVGATVVLIVITVAVLLLFQGATNPERRVFGSGLPFDFIGTIFFAAAAFAILNSILEEVVFRGILFDALESQWGSISSVFVTAIAFGVGHLQGYPPGRTGALLAGLYGLALGGLRVWTGGLALPIVAHFAADATIYAILARARVSS